MIYIGRCDKVTSKEGDKFLHKMQWLDHSVEDLIDATCFAMKQVPKIDENVWFGEISDSDESLLGTFYLSAVSGGTCRWFDHMSAEEASKFIVKELETDLA